MTDQFDLGDGGEFVDGPTELPAPWSPPSDPEFRTGTFLEIERADLAAAAAKPGLEPADSVQETMRFSRQEVQSLIAVRLQAAKAAQAPAAQAPAARAPAAQAEAAQAKAAQAKAAQAKVALARAARAAKARAAEAPLEHTAALPPRPLPRATDTEPVREGRRPLARRWYLIELAIAFALGVLTGVLAML